MINPTEKSTRLLVLDLDGTVRWGKEEMGRFVHGPEDVTIFPTALRQMRAWKRGGGRIIAVSNQGGVALGHLTLEQCQQAMAETHRQCGKMFDGILYCAHHPDASDAEMARCWCRKPAPGLLIEGALDLARQHGEYYPPHLGLFVGDREEDQECARIAGFDFQWATDWRAEMAR